MACNYGSSFQQSFQDWHRHQISQWQFISLELDQLHKTHSIHSHYDNFYFQNLDTANIRKEKI